jgi:hypothetical protein
MESSDAPAVVPALITPTYVWRVVLRGRAAGVTVVNHALTLFQESGAPSATPNAIAVDVRDNILNTTTWKGVFNGLMHWEAVTVTQLAPDPTTEQAALSFDYGGLSTLPSQVNFAVVTAAVTTWRTDRPGRSGRGRTYWVGIAQQSADIINACQWSPAYISRMETLANLWRTRYTLGGNTMALQFGVWSRSFAGSGFPVPTTAVARVTSHTNQAYICTMGSRRYGHGI